MLSTKPISVDERLIVAFDVPTADDAGLLVTLLDQRVMFYFASSRNAE
jgi:hypothetical protein